MLDRHSRIAMMPETQFFCGYLPALRGRPPERTHQAMVERALGNFFIRQAGLSVQEVMTFFQSSNATHPNLFRAMMQAYAAKWGKARPAEKSCSHLRCAPTLIDHYPEAQIICIVRDGRDVVRSNLSAPWGQGKRIGWFAREWIEALKTAETYQRSLPRNRFMCVKYEALMTCPERVLHRIMDFLNEPMETAQIQSSPKTATVPSYELAWKGRATDAPDAARVAAWRKQADRNDVMHMNYYMGRHLERWGYEDTTVSGVSWPRRVAWWLEYLPCRRGIYPTAVRLNRLWRRMIGAPVRKAAEDGAPAWAASRNTEFPSVR